MNENAKFVPREINPPNPLLRNVELKIFGAKCYEGDWEAKTERKLMFYIEFKMKEFGKNFLESLLEGSQGKGQIYKW